MSNVTTNPEHERAELEDLVQWIAGEASRFADGGMFHTAEVREALVTFIAKEVAAARVEAQNKLLNIGTGNAKGLASVNMGEVSDGYHTFNELYDFRKAYNALLFNEWAAQRKFNVYKSKLHSDGELPFGGGWFVVGADLPTGQITNHYELKDWDLFVVPEVPRAAVWVTHTTP